MTWLPKTPIIRCVIAALATSTITGLFGNDWKLCLLLDLSALMFVWAKPTSLFQQIFGALFLSAAVVDVLFAISGQAQPARLMRGDMNFKLFQLQMIALACDVAFLAIRSLWRGTPAWEALARLAVARGG